VHIKGADRRMDEIFEKDAVEKGGGKIVLTELVKGKSTTNTIERIRASK
jgi:D-beta-D-heptose 7-phosphate kinase/D-beta-D-heptose 1-phosphate adenosyltransferase